MAQRQLGVDIRTTRADSDTVLPMPTVLIVDRDRVVRFVRHPPRLHRPDSGRRPILLAALQTLPKLDRDPSTLVAEQIAIITPWPCSASEHEHHQRHAASPSALRGYKGAVPRTAPSGRRRAMS